MSAAASAILTSAEGEEGCECGVVHSGSSGNSGGRGKVGLQKGLAEATLLAEKRVVLKKEKKYAEADGVRDQVRIVGLIAIECLFLYIGLFICYFSNYILLYICMKVATLGFGIKDQKDGFDLFVL